MKTLKSIVIGLLMASSLATAQSFTNTVSTSVESYRVFNAVVGHDSARDVVDESLAFFMTLSTYSFSNPQTISGELSHNGVTYSLFENYHPGENPIVISPINEFFGENKIGSWRFILHTQTPLMIENWSIIPIIPEPSTNMLIGIGGLILLALKNRK